MPTISIDPRDFAELLGSEPTEAEFEKQLDLVKGEFKGLDEEGLWRVELNDTNRPDLWSAEGIARQMRAALGRRRDYPFFSGDVSGTIEVDPGIEEVRPYVAAFFVKGLKVTERSLVQIIQTQEKLAENFGRRRKDVAIGVYRADKIRFPVSYRAVDPKEHAYTPLGSDEPMSLADILERHPKGVEYRWILADKPKVPLLTDSAGLTLSMPPVINSRELGEVAPGDSNLFVEATGTDLANVILALNIMACDMADRGGRIERVRTLYPFDTPFGRSVDVPLDMDRSLSVPLSEFSRLLGVDVNKVEVDNMLERYGCDVRFDGDLAHVRPPATRADFLHSVDVVEDFAIARGYETFEPRLPVDFTPGRSAPVSVLENQVRDRMVGMGYEELISNILVSERTLLEKMNRPADPLVRIANVMNENYSALRDAVLPCLLQTEARSATAVYPHRLFEVGDVAVYDEASDCGSKTYVNLAALIAHREASLSEIHADLDYLLHMLGFEWSLSEAEFPSYLPGRCAQVRIEDRIVGVMGELHPAVLSSWEIGVPAAAFELTLDNWE